MAASLGIAGFDARIREPVPPQAHDLLKLDRVEGVSFRGNDQDLAAVAAFESGDAFASFRREVEAAVRRMADFADTAFLPAQAREVKDALALFELRLFDLQASFYGPMRGVLYGTGKRSLDVFASLLSHEAVPVEAKKAGLLELSREIVKCPPGAATHLSVAGRELQLRAGGMWEAVWATKERIAWAVVQEFIARHHASPEGGGDVHYRNTYFAHLHERLGLPRQEDAAQRGYQVSSDLLDQALQAVEQALSPAGVARVMAEECLGCIQQALARDHAGGIVPYEQVPALDALWESLAPRFGRFPMARVLTATEPDSDASPLRAMTRPDLLALSMLDSFRGMGLLVEASQQPKTLASWRAPMDGLSVKVDLLQWADEPLLWINEGGAPALFEFDHLLRFGARNLPDEAQRRTAIAAAIEQCPPARLHEVPLAWVHGTEGLVKLFSRFADPAQARDFVNANEAQLSLRDTETREAVARAAREGCMASLVPLLKLWNLLDAQEGEPSLMAAAVARGHAALVKALLAEGVSASVPGSRLLATATLAGHIEVMSALLDAGADPNEADPEEAGAPPLVVASMLHAVAAVRLLLAHPQTDLQATNVHGETALIACVRYGEPDLDTLKALLTRYDPEDGGGGSGTVLASAAMTGDMLYLNYLLDECGVNVDAVDAHGRTPLIEAATHGCVEALQALIDHGASLSRRDHAGYTAAHHALVTGGDTLGLLLDRLDPGEGTLAASLLMHAVKLGQDGALNRIVAWAPGLQDHDFGRTFPYPPCLIAAAIGAADCLDALIGHGFPIGRHAAYPSYVAVAARAANPSSVEVLASDYPEMVNLADHRPSGGGKTPLHYAVQSMAERAVVPEHPLSDAEAQNLGADDDPGEAMAVDPGGAGDPLAEAGEGEALDDDLPLTFGVADLPLDVEALVEASLRTGLLAERFGLVLARLADANAKWSVADVQGRTPLGYVLAPEHDALRARLLEFLDPAKQDHRAAVAAAAFQAVAEGRPQVLPGLLAWDASVADALNPLRRTLLTCAASTGRLDCLRLLAESCPERLESPDGSGATPLVAAVQGGAPEAVKLLLESGADVDARGQDGRTALDWAQLRNEPAIAALLVGPLNPALKRERGE